MTCPDPHNVQSFYDNLAADYTLLFADWRGSVQRQGEALAALIRQHGGAEVRTILDAACGIGTQAIGLALRGFDVTATDLSPAAVERARREAESFGVSIRFGVADLRTLAEQVPESFDAVIAMDNALPHLIDESDLRRALGNLRAKLRRGGLLIASIRDYDQPIQHKPRFDSARVMDGPEGRRITFQVWDWSDDGRTYVVNQFIVRQGEAGWQTSHYATTYRALSRAELTAALEAAGLRDIRWLTPEESGFYQPVVIARLARTERP